MEIPFLPADDARGLTPERRIAEEARALGREALRHLMQFDL
ncbi:hypothetical protein [Polyangium jinanense]|nr:hypothetical protein [Polyangium jinanense]